METQTVKSFMLYYNQLHENQQRRLKESLEFFHPLVRYMFLDVFVVNALVILGAELEVKGVIENNKVLVRVNTWMSFDRSVFSVLDIPDPITAWGADLMPQESPTHYCYCCGKETEVEVIPETYLCKTCGIRYDI